jgi:drug/metabolite transporter (DMT)-like permease
VIAVPVLGERLRPLQWVAVLTAMAGVVFLCDLQNLTFRAMDGVALLSALCSAIAVICVTRCRATDTSTNIFWSQSLFGAAIAVWPTVANWQAPSVVQWPWLLAIGLTASAGQLTMTYAYKHTGASQGSLLSLITPVISALIGVLYFREHFTGSFVIGSAMVLAACAYMAINPVAMRRSKPEAMDAQVS